MINDETIACVPNLLVEDRRFTISDIQREMVEHYLTQTSRTKIFHILTKELEMRKVNVMGTVHANRRPLPNSYDAGLEMLMQCNEEGESFLSQTVTGDVIRLHYWTPECESPSMIWKMADETVPQKFKEKLSVGKVLTTIFWDRKGVLILEYCGKGSTVTSVSYFDALICSLKAIKSKQPGLLK